MDFRSVKIRNMQAAYLFLAKLKSFSRPVVFLVMCVTAPSTTLPGSAPVVALHPRSVPGEAGINITRITEKEDVHFSAWIADMLSYDDPPPQNFSIAEGRMAYVDVNDGGLDVYTRELDGENPVRQTTFSGNVRGVSLSPDGVHIAYVEELHGLWNVFVSTWNIDPTPRQINRRGTSAIFPVFSPDSSTILFYGSQTNGYGICTYDLDTGNRAFFGVGVGLSFTPDGRKIATIRERGDTDFYEIWLVDLENGDESLVLSSKHRSYIDCAVSPDGKRIAVVSTFAIEGTPPNLDIFLANLDGTGLRQMTFHPGNDLTPRWSADGRSLYIVSQRGTSSGNYSIWRMDLD